MYKLLWALVVIEGAAIVWLAVWLNAAMASVNVGLSGGARVIDARMDRMTARLRRLEFQTGLQVMKDPADRDGHISVHLSELEPMEYTEYTDPDLFGVNARKGVSTKNG
ncbi:hypothetical protein [Burkholderia sp. L27(2015)]|uniref:hypothetical protein n=1 Tax=Burkholderia sp. L27(2015) TaxID=1641858 RepID=UPI00131C014E|nr:hypothetical protein [Burkholderia sp. L27(2015)]